MTKFETECFYPAEDYAEIDTKLEKLAKPLGGKNVGSGMMFGGERDITFSFKDLDKARKFYMKAKRLVSYTNQKIEF